MSRRHSTITTKAPSQAIIGSWNVTVSGNIGTNSFIITRKNPVIMVRKVPMAIFYIVSSVPIPVSFAHTLPDKWHNVWTYLLTAPALVNSSPYPQDCHTNQHHCDEEQNKKGLSGMSKVILCVLNSSIGGMVVQSFHYQTERKCIQNIWTDSNSWCNLL